MNFRGCRTKPGLKIGEDQAARPLAGAEVLVAVVRPSPGEGGRKNSILFYCSKYSVVSFYPTMFSICKSPLSSLAIRREGVGQDGVLRVRAVMLDLDKDMPPGTPHPRTRKFVR